MFHPSVRPGNLTRLDISENHIQCDTRICWALQPPWVPVLNHTSDMVCDGPAHLAGDLVSDVALGCPTDREYERLLKMITCF